MKYTKTEGIILKTSVFFEKDKLIELFSPTLGKLRILAKRAYRKNTRFNGLLERTHHVQIEVYQGRSFPLLIHCNLTNHFPKIRCAYDDIQLACYLLDLVRKSTVYEQPNSDLFNLLLATLHQLETKDRSRTELRDWFHQKFLICEGLHQQSDTRVNTSSFQKAFESYSGFPTLAINQ